MTATEPLVAKFNYCEVSCNQHFLLGLKVLSGSYINSLFHYSNKNRIKLF